MPDPLDTYAARYAAMLDKMLGRPMVGRVSYALADCPVCDAPAISPTTGECFNCNRDPDELEEP